MQKNNTTKISDIKRSWYLIDVSQKILGRAATEISLKLRGKAKPYFVSNLDCGDYIVVINAGKIMVTGKKAETKVYSRFSGYPGGLKRESYKELIVKNPQKIIRNAVSGMLPDNKLKSRFLKRLYIYKDDNHPYQNKFIKKG